VTVWASRPAGVWVVNPAHDSFKNSPFDPSKEGLDTPCLLPNANALVAVNFSKKILHLTGDAG